MRKPLQYYRCLRGLGIQVKLGSACVPPSWGTRPSHPWSTIAWHLRRHLPPRPTIAIAVPPTPTPTPFSAAAAAKPQPAAAAAAAS